MTSSTARILIVGGGVFGITAALSLRRRNWQVTVLDPGPLPRDVAASTDLSKVVRMDYGADPDYTGWARSALEGWRTWNREFTPPVYHEDGFLVLTRGGMKPGSFEHESFETLRAAGVPLERMDGESLSQRFPAWHGHWFADGYFNPSGGWSPSELTMRHLVQHAQEAGIELREGETFCGLIERGGRVIGLRTANRSEWRADVVLVAAGAWTPTLLPELASVMWATSQPIFHLRVPDPPRWQAPRFPVWAADIATTGWYGFPALPDGTLKIAHHGAGRRIHPVEPRAVSPAEIERLRTFLQTSLPALADAPLAGTRACLYCDTFDGDFWIDHDPDRPGLVVAAGDSGHAFKFAPVLGDLIADVVMDRDHPMRHRFRHRQATTGTSEAARATT